MKTAGRGAVFIWQVGCINGRWGCFTSWCPGNTNDSLLKAVDIGRWLYRIGNISIFQHFTG